MFSSFTSIFLVSKEDVKEGIFLFLFCLFFGGLSFFLFFQSIICYFFSIVCIGCEWIKGFFHLLICLPFSTPEGCASPMLFLLCLFGLIGLECLSCKQEAMGSNPIRGLIFFLLIFFWGVFGLWLVIMF